MSLTFVNVDDPRVAEAISFVEDEAAICPRATPYALLRTTVDRLPWIYYTPAFSPEEIEERELLIQRYGAAEPHQIEFYLFYHNCDDFSVFYWTSLRANGVVTRIVSQTKPFRHTYLLTESGEPLDALLHYCDVDYPYSPETSTVYDTPHDFYAGVFISKEDRRQWEIDLLDRLKRLE